MNEFNPFETLGIDPNESMPNRIPLETETQVNPMETMWQFNPFKELNINVNWFPQPTANGKDTEVSSMLWINDFTPMTDEEKQSYVDALSDEDWNIWNNLKSEWYSFEARKALMENQDMLYDINEEGTWKYYQAHQSPIINSLTNLKQKQLDFYQDKIAWWSNKAAEEINKFINYEQKWVWLYADEYVEKEPYTWQKFLNVAWSVISKILSWVEHLTNLAIHQQAWIYNTAINKLNPTYEKVSWDAKNENYESKIAAAIWLGNDVLWTYFAANYPIATTLFGIVAQNDWFIAQWLNWIDTNLTKLVNKIFNIPLMQEWIQQPGNAWIEEDLTEGITQWIYLLLMAKTKKAFWRTKAWMKLNEIRGKVNEWVKNSIRRWKELGDRSKWEMINAWEVTPEWEFTDIAKENISNATKQGMKYWRREVWNKKPVESKPTELWLPEDKTSITPKEGTTNPTEGWPTIITPETTDVTEKPTENKTIAKNDKLIQLAKDTKLSENTITNLESNPDLQTEFQNTIKPYLEENGNNNPEWVIVEPVNNLVYDIRSWIEELRTQQANLNRSINNQKLSPMEKALIKEIEKIIDQKEPKQILKKLWKLTPAQQWLMQRIVPNLDSRVQTINQMLELTKEITKGNLLSRFLKFQAERPRRGITWFAKKLLYNFVKEAYEQKGLQASTEAIDKFIEWLSDEQIDDITETLYKKQVWWKYDDNLLSKMELELYKTPFQKAHEKGYLPETDRRVLNEKWSDLEADDNPNNKIWIKPVTESLEKNLNRKIPGRNETIWEFYKRKGLEITVFKDLSDMLNAVEATAQAFYAPYYDRFGALAQTPQMDVLLHEYWHRVLCQLWTFEFIKILQYISKRDWITERAAEERFAEYVRNYFVYGKMDGELQNTLSKEERKGLAVMDILEKVMEKERKKIFDVFDISKDDAEISDLLYQIKMDTPKIQEINKRQPQHLLNDTWAKSTWLKSKRVSWLQENIDPNIKEIRFNEQGQWIIKYKDRTKKTRTEFLDWLTEKQKSMVDVYQATPEELKLKEQWFQWEWKFNYETFSNEESSLNINIQKFLERHPEFNKMESNFYDIDLSEFKRVAWSEIRNIHVNEDWVLVWSYHWHKDVPIWLDLDLEEVNIPDDLRQILQKQADEYLEKQNEDVINRIEELNKQDLLVK